MSYKRLGDYIQPVNIRNKDLEVTTLLGVSIKKVLMPSIANTIGTNMKTYKIIKQNQFAYGPVTSRNGDKISIALLEEHETAIVSQAYTVFEVIDEQKVLPEYLMMWFRRPEFDRFARFKSHGSAREVFDWEELCETQLPIPSIEKQHQMVAEYNTVSNRIKLNEQLNQKFEETAQALYKHWFVDFEFPNAENKPYKSSGGEMVYNEELDKDIPVGWELINIKSCILDSCTGGDAIRKTPIVKYDTGIRCARVGDISKRNEPYQWAFANVNESDLKRFKLKKNNILVTRTATLGLNMIMEKDINSVFNNGLIRLILDNNIVEPLYFYRVINTIDFMQYINAINAGSSTRPNMKIDYLLQYSFIKAKKKTQTNFVNYYLIFKSQNDTLLSEIDKLTMLQELLLSKMTHHTLKPQAV